LIAVDWVSRVDHAQVSQGLCIENQVPVRIVFSNVISYFG
jgi:hypothetical protein